MLNCQLITLNTKKNYEKKAVENFLQKFSLSFDETVDYTVGLYLEEKLIGVGSTKENIIRNLAIEDQYQGEGLLAKLVQHLLDYLFAQKIYSVSVFTKTRNIQFFENLGFKLLGRVEQASMLEYSIDENNLTNFLVKMTEFAQILPKGSRAGIVMNANPFTLGHLYLVELASRENDVVIVMVVEEDKAKFSFSERIELVRQGTAHLNNVWVIPSGKYIVSSKTFPAYFTKGMETIEAQTRLDATLFAEKIAPCLKINIRYVGEEPYCPITNHYNKALQEILPKNNVAVKIVSRKEVETLGYISASKVRDFLEKKEFAKLKTLVPKSTWEYLQKYK